MEVLLLFVLVHSLLLLFFCSLDFHLGKKGWDPTDEKTVASLSQACRWAIMFSVPKIVTLPRSRGMYESYANDPPSLLHLKNLKRKGSFHWLLCYF